eukprot:gene374-406_t
MEQEGGQPKIVVHGKFNKTNKGEEVDISAMIDHSGCAQIYYDLEECLGENDRDWRKCQTLVQSWKVCYQKKDKERDQQWKEQQQQRKNAQVAK